MPEWETFMLPTLICEGRYSKTSRRDWSRHGKVRSASRRDQVADCAADTRQPSRRTCRSEPPHVQPLRAVRQALACSNSSFACRMANRSRPSRAVARAFSSADSASQRPDGTMQSVIEHMRMTLAQATTWYVRR
eukprot:3514455-Pleurochrysis_carterae.AAC.2